MSIARLPTRFVLIIAEKPRAAEKIARALDPQARRILYQRVPVWIIKWGPIGTAVVAPAAGHLFELHTDERGVPVFNCRWVPRYLVDPRSRHTKRFYQVLKTLSSKAVEFINACDYDIEGSLIGFLIIKFFGDLRRARRAKFSSLVATDIRSAFAHLTPLDFNMAEAGECRHRLDWLWGINISRILMDLFSQRYGTRKVLSAGRVQSPTLAHAVDLELQRRTFIPIPRIEAVITVEVDGKELTLVSRQEFRSREEARKFLELSRSVKYADIVSIDVDRVTLPPPHPFNLPDLQAEASKLFKISPYQVQKIAEDLYLDALISYPRTNSQRLPPSLNNREILHGLSRDPNYSKLVAKLLAETRGVLRPNNGPKDDPAHPAIHPTGELPTEPLKPLHRKIFDLIVRRYLATFAPPAVLLKARITLRYLGLLFDFECIKVLKKGWLEYYPFSKPSERIIDIDSLKRSRRVLVKRVKIRIRFVGQKPSITKLSLLRWMEEQGIGTESTRAEIIETLYRRGYIMSRGGRTQVSDLGIAVIEILRRHVPELTSVDLTRKFETYIEMIRLGRKHCNEILEEAKAIISRYVNKLKSLLTSIASEFDYYIESDEASNYSKYDRCLVCNRRAMYEGFCPLHYLAYRAIVSKFKQWKDKGFTWQEYLTKILTLRSSGSLVKEVAKYLKSRPFSILSET